MGYITWRFCGNIIYKDILDYVLYIAECVGFKLGLYAGAKIY